MVQAAEIPVSVCPIKPRPGVVVYVRDTIQSLYKHKLLIPESAKGDAIFTAIVSAVGDDVPPQGAAQLICQQPCQKGDRIILSASCTEAHYDEGNVHYELATFDNVLGVLS